jgi:hypothetical protein
MVQGNQMQIDIKGCKDKKFKKYVNRAVDFYGQELINKRINNNIDVCVKFTNKINAWGYASIEEYNTVKKPRSFLLEVHSGIGAKHILQTLAHEMIHIKQFIYGELNEELDNWCGMYIDTTVMDYYLLPWEVEAYGREVGLFTKFAIKEQLWNVFESIYNPDDPIIDVELGWKK